MPEDEEDDGAGIAGCSVMLGLARMKLATIRISGTRRGSERVAGRGVSQRSGHGGFGHEGKEQGRSERGRGCVASREDPGEEEAAGGGSRRWSSGARASARLCLLAEVEDGGELGWASATVLDQHRSWAGSGGLHG